MDKKLIPILVVDDEPFVLRFITSFLESAGFTNIHAARNGSDALTLFQKLDGKVDVVIADLGLPDMDGGDMVMNLLGKNGELKVIITTGFDGDCLPEMVRAKATLLTKPFGGGDLVAAMEQLMGAAVSS